MYFHSASYSHEQYAALRAAALRNKAKNKRTSRPLHTTGFDSGYTSSAGSSPNSKQPSPLSRRATEDSSQSSRDVPDVGGKTAPAVRQPKKKTDYTKAHPASQHRRPDVVYSSPRPMAFPFHNDAIFLPVAEADPRDVARVAPTVRKTPSVQSSKASSLAQAPFDQPSAYRSIRSKSSASHHTTDTDTLHSHRSSILSNMQRGTVRSLRSLFQSPTHSTDGSQAERLPRLQARNGTVQSLRDMFNRPASAPIHLGEERHDRNSVLSASSRTSFSSDASLLSHKPLPPAPPSTPASIHSPKPSRLASLFSWADRSTPKKQPKPTTTKTTAKSPTKATATVTQPRLSKLASILSLPRPPSAPPRAEPVAPVTLPNTPLSTSSPPPPPPPKPPKSAFSSLKKLSSQMFSRSTPSPDRPLPTEPPVRRSLFSSLRRSNTPSDDPLQKKPDDTLKKAQEEEIIVESETTVMGRLWKGFKRLVTGKKTSRVGIL